MGALHTLALQAMEAARPASLEESGTLEFSAWAVRAGTAAEEGERASELPERAEQDALPAATQVATALAMPAEALVPAAAWELQQTLWPPDPAPLSD